MAYPSKTEEFDDLFSTTTALVLPGTFNQALTTHKIMGPMTRNRVTHNMGTEIKFVPELAGGRSVGYVRSSTGGFKFAGTAVATTARLDPAILVGYTIISEEEEKRNGDSDVQIASLVDLKARQFTRDWKVKMVEAFYGNGVIDGQPALRGLLYWVPTNPGALTIANLSQTTFPWWASRARPACGDWAVNGMFGSTLNYPLNAYVAVSDDEQPDTIISDAGLMQVAINRSASNLRFINAGDANKIGSSDDLTFMGRKWIWDKECQAGTMLMLHSRDFTFVVQEGANDEEGMFETLPVYRLPDNPLVKVSFSWTRHQLVCTRPNEQIRLSGWTVPA
jgi:hypothetical protein